MKLKTNCPEFYNDISETIRAFMEMPMIELAEENADITVEQQEKDGQIFTKTEYNGFNYEFSEQITKQDAISLKRIKKHGAKLSVYYCLKKALNKQMPWGSLTGIRPTKLLRDVKDVSVLTDKYDLPINKGELLQRIVVNQTPYFTPQKDEVDIYIGIPFCKTRCTYCSFSSTDSTKGEKLMIPYVKALIKEIEDTALLIKALNKQVRCIYIGGGTPTALTTPLFKDMLECASMHFKPKMEFTVEAGRPDTITEEKLRLIKQAGADRISINPQSMNEQTLKKVGRSHSPQEIVDCYSLARQIGFKTINADLIAGLPDETPEMFFYSLNEVLKLQAENITVHTLSLKRGSKMSEEKMTFANEKDVQKMVEGAQEILISNGYEPYYLYRQKYMTGNFENIGYALKNHTGVYNIDIMEETTDIIALGCGGVSKRVFKEEDRLERAFNFKSIYEYIQRIDEANLRKKQLFELN